MKLTEAARVCLYRLCPPTIPSPSLSCHTSVTAHVSHTQHNSSYGQAKPQFDTFSNSTDEPYIGYIQTEIHVPSPYHNSCIGQPLAMPSLPPNASSSSIYTMFFYGKTCKASRRLLPILKRLRSLHFDATIREFITDSIPTFPL